MRHQLHVIIHVAVCEVKYRNIPISQMKNRGTERISNLPKPVMLGILAPEAKPLATMSARLLGNFTK